LAAAAVSGAQTTNDLPEIALRTRFDSSSTSLDAGARRQHGIEHAPTMITPSGAAGASARSAAEAKYVAQTTNDPFEIAPRARPDSSPNALDTIAHSTRGIEHSPTTITPSGAARALTRSAAEAKRVAQTTDDTLEIARRARLDSLSDALDSALAERPLNPRLVQQITQSLQYEADALKQEAQELGDQLLVSAGKRPLSTSRGGSDVAGGSSDTGDYSESDLYKDFSGDEARRDASALRDSIERMRREERPYPLPDVDSFAQAGGGNTPLDWQRADPRDLRGDDRELTFPAIIAHFRGCGARSRKNPIRAIFAAIIAS
jgi:hypothetical protein